jgi:hypothetical protein
MFDHNHRCNKLMKINHSSERKGCLQGIMRCSCLENILTGRFFTIKINEHNPTATGDNNFSFGIHCGTFQPSLFKNHKALLVGKGNLVHDCKSLNWSPRIVSPKPHLACHSNPCLENPSPCDDDAPSLVLLRGRMPKQALYAPTTLICPCLYFHTSSEAPYFYMALSICRIER